MSQIENRQFFPLVEENLEFVEEVEIGRIIRLRDENLQRHHRREPNVATRSENGIPNVDCVVEFRFEEDLIPVRGKMIVVEHDLRNEDIFDQRFRRLFFDDKVVDVD